MALKHLIHKETDLVGPDKKFPWRFECGFCPFHMNRPSQTSAMTAIVVHVKARHPEKITTPKESK